MQFKLLSKDSASKARAGEITTDHGKIETPFFMPIATTGAVKAVHLKELEEVIRSQIILCNTYHLYLRPGTEIIQQAGGIHQFIGWNKPMLSDSGGYQVYSLNNFFQEDETNKNIKKKTSLRKISEEGVWFQSHIDGSKHFFSPENVIDIERKIGADIIMVFDECTPYPCEYDYAKNSMEMTHRWLKRCCDKFDNTIGFYDYQQTLIPIVQGSVYKDLRKQSAETIASLEREGNAIGGLSVGEPHELLYEMTEIVCNILPEDKPRYLMGVGTPVNLLESIALGIDMFDCVMPTRNGRNGGLFTSNGMINIRNKKWENDFSPIDEHSQALTSRVHTKSYLHHLIKSKEILGLQIASINNLTFYLWLMREARKHILEGDFIKWKNKMVKKVSEKL